MARPHRRLFVDANRLELVIADSRITMAEGMTMAETTALGEP